MTSSCRASKKSHRHDAAGFNVCADEHVQSRSAGGLPIKVQLRVLAHFFVGDKLYWVALGDWRGDFSEITAIGCVYFDLRITRDVDRIVAIEIKRLAVCAHRCFAVETDQSDFVIVVIELQRCIGSERCGRNAGNARRLRRERRRCGVLCLRGSSERNTSQG